MKQITKELNNFQGNSQMNFKLMLRIGFGWLTYLLLPIAVISVLSASGCSSEPTPPSGPSGALPTNVSVKMFD